MTLRKTYDQHHFRVEFEGTPSRALQRHLTDYEHMWRSLETMQSPIDVTLYDPSVKQLYSFVTGAMEIPGVSAVLQTKVTTHKLVIPGN